MTGQQLKNSILQMAVQGKLVPQDPNDEPASVLLARIRKEKEELIKAGKIKKEKNPSYIFRGADNLPYEKVGKNEPVCIADKVPFEIPESWEWVRLGNNCRNLFSMECTSTLKWTNKDGSSLVIFRITLYVVNRTLWTLNQKKLIVSPNPNDILFARMEKQSGKSYLVRRGYMSSYLCGLLN